MAEIHFKVDHESLRTEHHELTPEEILHQAKIDPKAYFLVQLKGEERIPYADKSNEKIKMHDGMRFISVSKSEGEIHYKVDDEPQKTKHRELSPNEILEHAKIDPKTNYLVQIKGKERISYKDKPNEKIPMHDGMRFVSVSTGPTPVSH